MKWPGWIATGRGLDRRFTHPTGWVVHHCGHPTANWPWACVDPGGVLHTGGIDCDRGYAFRHLDQAIVHAESHIRGAR